MEKKWIKFGVPLTGLSKKGESMANFANEIKHITVLGCSDAWVPLGFLLKQSQVFGGSL